MTLVKPGRSVEHLKLEILVWGSLEPVDSTIHGCAAVDVTWTNSPSLKERETERQRDGEKDRFKKDREREEDRERERQI